MASKKKLPTGVSWDASDKSYKLDLKRKRLRGGRLSISLRTDNAKEAERAASAIETLYERGDFTSIERLRGGEIALGDVRAAVREGSFDRLKTVNRAPITVSRAQELTFNAAIQEKQPKTIRQIEYYGSAFVKYFGPDRPLVDITVDELRVFITAPRPARGKREGKPWSANTRINIHVHGSRMWNAAIEYEAEQAEASGVLPALKKNPWAKVERPEVQATRVVFLSIAEWRTFVLANKGRPSLAYIACGALAGLRRKEAAQLRVNVDIDMEKKLLRVQPRTGRFPWKPKTKRSTRIVPMCEELHRILSEHFSMGFAGETYMFHSPGADQPLEGSTLTKWTRMAFTRAGIEYGRKETGKTNHTLRHTFATWLLLNGVTPHVVARLMGDSVMMVLNTYAHLLPENLEQAITTLDRIIPV